MCLFWTEWTLIVRASFVDRDMFLRYTDLGIGHPVALRRTVRDCCGLQAPAEAMDVDEGAGDGEDNGEDDDEQLVDVDLSDEESEDEDDEVEEDPDDDGHEEDVEEEFDELSF